MKLSTLCLALVGLLLVGCSRNKPLEPLALADIPAQAPQVFADADPAAKQILDAGLKAVSQKQPSQAWALFKKLTAQPGLSKQQRQFAARAVMTLSEEVTKAVDAGDKEAARMRRIYRANK